MMGLGMGPVWLVIIIALFAGFELFIGHAGRGSSHDSRSALEILKTRYAAGEITRTEHEVKKRQLA